jgi:hypothetical protein
MLEPASAFNWFWEVVSACWRVAMLALSVAIWAVSASIFAVWYLLAQAIS